MNKVFYIFGPSIIQCNGQISKIEWLFSKCQTCKFEDEK